MNHHSQCDGEALMIHVYVTLIRISSMEREKKRDILCFQEFIIEYLKLISSSEKNSTEAARALLKKKPNIDREKDAKGQTPLHHAVYWGNLNMVKLLLEHDHSTAYYRDLEGHLPIHIAVQLNNVKIFLVLYSTCPDSVDVRNKKGENVLHMAIRSSSTGELVKFIGIRSELRRLMNHQDENGNTPLHLAILEGRFHRDFNLFLQSKEVDPWVKNNIGDTAIDLFCSRMDKLLPNELVRDLVYYICFEMDSKMQSFS